MSESKISRPNVAYNEYKKRSLECFTVSPNTIKHFNNPVNAVSQRVKVIKLPEMKSEAIGAFEIISRRDQHRVQCLVELRLIGNPLERLSTSAAIETLAIRLFWGWNS